MTARGFTLVEALVAFAILAVALVTFYEAMGTGFRTFDKAAQIGEAVLAAQSELDLITAMRRLPSAREGMIDGTNLHWRLDVRTPRAPEGPSPSQLAVLRLSVSGDGWRRTITLDRLMLVPREVQTP